MSIEITGPDRYEFQYSVTLELALRFWNQRVEVYVEAGEDAALKADVDGKRIEIEVQVKGAKSADKAVDRTLLRDYLAHFPPHQAANCLLERLLSQPGKLVLFVFAQRVMDFCSPLTVPSDWRGTYQMKAPLSATAADEFLAAIKAYPTAADASELEDRRRDALQKVAHKTTRAALNIAFARLKLQESTTLEGTQARAREHLRTLGVSNDQLESVWNQMLAQIRTFKGTTRDVAPALDEVLRATIRPSVRPKEYIPRGKEDTWIAKATEKRAVLLSGPPRCGKTDTAKWVAASFQDQGFEVQHHSMVDEAERALLDLRRAEIVVLLDDPLGSDFEQSAGTARSLSKLDRLLRELPANRRLVVAQSQEVLLAAKGEKRLGDVTTGGLGWEDLGIQPTGFLSNVWAAHASRNHVPRDVSEALTAAIEANVVDFPTGVLAHLAAHHESLTGRDVVQQAQTLASLSASDFAFTLSATGAGDVVRALAVGTTTVEASADRELAFILGHGDELPVPKSLGVSWPPPDEETPALPAYGTMPEISDDARQKLAQLERHRLLERNQTKSLQFTHPYYRAAARAVVARSVSMEEKEVLSAIRRALFSLAPNTSAAAARNLWWLYRDLDARLGVGDALVAIAEDGLRWYFPKTRDLCYEFLLGLAKSKPDRYSKQIQRWIDLLNEVKLSDIVWADVPFLPEDRSRTVLSFLNPTVVPAWSEVEMTARTLSEGDALPSLSAAEAALRYFKHHPELFRAQVLMRFLSFDEGLIRAEAAYIWLRTDRPNDERVMARLARETHPSVIGRVVEAAIDGWEEFGSDERHRRAALLRALTTDEESASVIVTTLLHHSYDHEYSLVERNEPAWGLVGEVLPTALRSFPTSFWISTKQLADVCTRAFGKLPTDAAESISEAWLDLLARWIQAGRSLDGYIVGLLPYVFRFADFSPSTRLPFVRGLLELPSTAISLVTLLTLLDNWSKLSGEERSVVTRSMASSREDAVWLKAVAITQTRLPAAVRKPIFGEENVLDLPPETVATALPHDLLAAGVRTHLARSSIFEAIGFPRSRSSKWIAIVGRLARSPQHPLFKECLQELYENFANQYGKRELYKVIQELDAPAREQVFDFMLEWKRGVLGNWHQKEFDLILDMAPSDGARASLIKRMVESAPFVIEELGHITDWTRREDAQRALHIRFVADFAVYVYFNKLEDIDIDLDDRELVDEVVQGVLTLISHRLPSFPETHFRIRSLLNGLQADAASTKSADSFRELAIKNFLERHSLAPRSHPISLPHWSGPA